MKDARRTENVQQADPVTESVSSTMLATTVVLPTLLGLTSLTLGFWRNLQSATSVDPDHLSTPGGGW